MKLHIIQDLKNCGPLPLIYSKRKPTISKKNDKNKESLKVDIKTQPQDINSEMLSIYVLIFKTG